MEDFRNKREDGSCPVKAGASRSTRESWDMCISEMNNTHK